MAKTVEPTTGGSISKRMIFFALPLLLGNLFQQLYNTVDSLIVGNFPGSSALAAVSSSGSLIFMLIGFLSGISSGAGVVVSRYFGAEDKNSVHCAVHTTVAFGLVAGVLMTAAGVLLSPQILIWMGTPESVMPESITCLQIYFSGSLGFVMYNIFVGILQAIGDSRHPLYYLMLSSVINLVLDILFIELLRTHDSYQLQITKIRFDANMPGQIIRIGLPSGVQNSIIAFANVVVQSYINAFGEMAMAGYGAYSKIEGFAFLPINSFTMVILSELIGIVAYSLS